jgi:nucleoid-associated protein YgaU
MKIILSLYPNRLGFGYACAQMPHKLLDHGILNVRPATNDKVMGHINRFATYFRPTILLLRDGSHADRMEQLSDDIEAYAKESGIPVFRYTRKQISDVFELFGATTKLEIAQKIIEKFPELEDRKPSIRKPWLPESYNMGIFDAIALAVVHHYLTE